MLGFPEPHVVPGESAILAPVDAIPIGDAALVVVLAGSHPDDGRIPGIYLDVADGIRAVGVEDRGPGGPVIAGEPNAAGSLGNEVVAGAVGEHRDLRDAAGNECRADVAGAQSGERGG